MYFYQQNSAVLELTDFFFLSFLICKYLSLTVHPPFQHWGTCSSLLSGVQGLLALEKPARIHLRSRRQRRKLWGWGLAFAYITSVYNLPIDCQAVRRCLDSKGQRREDLSVTHSISWLILFWNWFLFYLDRVLGLPGGSDGKESACSAGNLSLIPELGRSLEEATHSSILAWRSPMDRGAWQVAAHGVAKNRMQLSD